jgi:TonB family protein
MFFLPSVLLSALMAATPSQVAAADTLDVVRQLYASADYESALVALDRLVPEEIAAVTETDRYRALCLMALGRTADAEAVFERIVRANPSYEPDGQEPPRVRAAFTSVRTRVLPDVARELYNDGKTAYDRKDYPAAITAFERTMSVLEHLEADDRTLGDLRTLAGGFLDLSRAAVKPAPAPPPPPEPTPAESSPPPTASAPPEPAPGVSEPAKGPAVIQQHLPPWNPAWFGSQFQSEFRGAVEVVIDESGAVVSARVIEPIHPDYDRQLLDAATRWRYVPAERNGKPVASTKRVDVILRPRD